MNLAVGPQILDLPISKLRVRAQRPSLFTMVAAGAFPTELTSVVLSMVESDAGGLENQVKTVEGFRLMSQLIETLLPSILLSPRVGPQTALETEHGIAVGTIALNDIPDLDKRYLLLFSQHIIRPDTDLVADEPPGGAGALTKFPDESGDGDAGRAREAIRTAAVDVAGHVAVEPASA